MLLRGLAVVAMVVLALALLAMPLSTLGIIVNRQSSAGSSGLYLRDGYLGVSTSPPGLRPGFRSPWERDEYHIFTAPSNPDLNSTSAGWRVPLWAIAAGAMVVLSICVGWPYRVTRRRRRNGQCVRCGYDRRASGDGPCPECGLVPDGKAPAAVTPIGAIVRDGGVGLFAALLLLAFAGYGVVRLDRRAVAVHQARLFDYSWYLEQTRPKLTGEVLFAQPGEGPDSIGAVVQRAGRGATIVLLPGRHDLRERPPGNSTAAIANEVWLLGSGMNVTTLQMSQSSAAGLRIENLTIDCDNDDFLDVRQSGTIHLRNCRVMNYNSGAGGSTALLATNVLLLIEGCEFEGKSGRQSDSATNRGNPLRLNLGNVMCLRDTRFVDNASLWSVATPGVVDGCSVRPTGAVVTRMFTGGIPQYVRALDAPAGRAVPGVRAFTEALDDAAILARVPAGRLPSPLLWSDPVARKAAEALDLDGNGGRPFWRRLLLHPDSDVRAIAARQANPPPLPLPPMSLDAAIAALATPSPAGGPSTALAKDVVFTLLLTDAALVRSRLEAICDGDGPEEARHRAAMVLQLMTAQPSLPELVRFESLAGS